MRGILSWAQTYKKHAKKCSVVGLLLLSLGLGLFSVKPASATTFVLSGSVKDSLGNAIVHATISVEGASTGSVTTDSSGNYSIFVPQGTYTVQATPPAGSSFSSAIAYGQVVSGDKTLNFVLSPAGTVTFSGHLYNGEGTPLENQELFLFVPGNAPISRSVTDSSGKFSLTAAPGTYSIIIGGKGAYANNDYSKHIPQLYSVSISNYLLTKDTLRDITLPTKKITIHVEDESGNPLSGMRVSTGGIGLGRLSLGNDLTATSGDSQYIAGQGPATDASGNVTLWGFPATHNFIVTPPSGSPYLTKTLRNVSITTDTSLTIPMQQPVTLSGRILDALGNGLSSQQISAIVPGNPASATSITDPAGNYTLKVAPGTYNLSLFGRDDSFTKNIPQVYNLSISNYTISQNKQQDITMPARKVEIHVQDIANNPIAGTMLTTGTTGFNAAPVGDGLVASGGNQYIPGQGPKTDAAGNVTLWLMSTTYNLTATPPSGSGYSQVVLRDTAITADTQKTITMTRPVTFSGHVYDALGNPLANQQVSVVTPGNMIATATTGVDGSYSMQFTSGTYKIYLFGSNPDFSKNTPQVYHLYSGNVAFSQNTYKEITLPLKQVQIHVQDAFNTPLQGVRLTTGHASFVGSYPMGDDLSSTEGINMYTPEPGPATDASGNVTLWLFPTTYNLTATPPSGGAYNTITLTNVPITGDETKVISLQYAHNPPTTAANLSPDPLADGTYPNPVSVTLDASAESGYTVANSYYSIDGGQQQTYTAPFTIEGDGDHAITYWSVDNTGVREAPKTKTFTIRSNVAPTIDPVPGATIDEGDAYTSNSTFTDPGSSSWTATVDYGDGAGPEPLPLSGNSFTLNHTYKDEGSYAVTVSVTDNYNETSTATTAITVTNVAPSIGAISASFNPIEVNQSTTASADFTDPGVLDTHTATWDWGDGSTSTGTVIEANGSGSVSDSHTYTETGVYAITLTLTDNDGAVRTQLFKYLSVYNPTASAHFTGTNHFDAPVGTYVPNPSLTGKVKFGIMAKYQNGQPNGTFKLDFSAANFSFESTSFTLLVIANNTATLRGTGTVNGSAGYTFLATGVGGAGQDNGSVRLQIKDAAGTAVFDTQPGADDIAVPTTGVTGRVVVHQ